MTTTTVANQSVAQIKALSLDGVAPSDANVTAGTYRFVREVFLVAKAEGSPAALSFIAFVKSADGGRVIKDNGALPRKGR
jgi:phosphate transport system substrate-binding protein